MHFPAHWIVVGAVVLLGAGKIRQDSLCLWFGGTAGDRQLFNLVAVQLKTPSVIRLRIIKGCPFVVG
jgi:hypothetical protein